MKYNLLVFLLACTTAATGNDSSDIEETSSSDTELSLEPLCDDEGTPEDAECWTKLLDAEDCYVWSTVNNRDLFAALKANSVDSCPERVLNGSHPVTFSYTDSKDNLKTEVFEGPWKNGRMGAGKWVDRNTPHADAFFSGYRNDKGQKIGEWEGESDDGEITWTIQYRNGKRHGDFRRETRDGAWSSLEYRDGDVHGTARVEYSDGSSETSEWRNDELNGTMVRRNSHGNVIFKLDFKDTKWHGTHLANHYANEEDSNFVQQHESHYVDDEPVGKKIIRYDDDSDGEVDAIETIPYVDGKLTGIAVYEADGYRAEVPCVDGVRQGVQESTWANGDRMETPYVDGKVHGVKVFYWKEASHRRETPFEDDKEHGVEVWYGKDDKVLVETPYERGKKHGVEIHYWEDGSRTETPYINGRQHGTVNWIDEEGDIVHSEKFMHGELETDTD